METLKVYFSPKEYKRFFDNISVNKETGCWIWMGAKDQSGYGQGFYRGKRERVHRVIYSLIKGSIPRCKEDRFSNQLDHLCRNHACCNPEHLEMVTQKTNVLRGVGITAQNARKTFCKWGHKLPPYNPNESRKFCKTCDSIRHKKRMQGDKREYWLKKAREATYRHTHKTR